jgi:hypothetical protein
MILTTENIGEAHIYEAFTSERDWGLFTASRDKAINLSHPRNSLLARG